MAIRFEETFIFDKKFKNSIWLWRTRLNQYEMKIDEAVLADTRKVLSPGLSYVIHIDPKEKGLTFIVNNRGDMDPWFDDCARMIKLTTARLILVGALELIWYEDEKRYLGGLWKKVEKGFALQARRPMQSPKTYLDHCIIKAIRRQNGQPLQKQIDALLDVVLGSYDVRLPARRFVYQVLNAQSRKTPFFAWKKSAKHKLGGQALQVDMSDKNRQEITEEFKKIQAIYQQASKINTRFARAMISIQNAVVVAVRRKTENEHVD
ncbi:MAG: hypothetical protein AB8F95_17230 [Bacteroidia bacterium]